MKFRVTFTVPDMQIDARGVAAVKQAISGAEYEATEARVGPSGELSLTEMRGPPPGSGPEVQFVPATLVIMFAPGVWRTVSEVDQSAGSERGVENPGRVKPPRSRRAT